MASRLCEHWAQSTQYTATQTNKLKSFAKLQNRFCSMRSLWYARIRHHSPPNNSIAPRRSSFKMTI